jgi:iron complex outermembrane recepter protein
MTGPSVALPSSPASAASSGPLQRCRARHVDRKDAFRPQVASALTQRPAGKSDDRINERITALPQSTSLAPIVIATREPDGAQASPRRSLAEACGDLQTAATAFVSADNVLTGDPMNLLTGRSLITIQKCKTGPLPAAPTDGRDSRSGLRRHPILVGGVTLSFAAAALAQEAQVPSDPTPAADVSPSAPLQEIVVTSSRIVREGYNAPTPTTVLDAEHILAAAPATLADYVNQLPSLVGSATPHTGITAAGVNVGANLLNLRGLGANRTLVLLDGHRVAPSTLTGNTDTSLLPQALIRRVDVVTGGASAAWGSDAVAGVVNFVLDKEFTGLSANIQGGATEQGDTETSKADISFGTGFAEGRGHLLFSAEFNDTGAGDAVTSRDWFRGYKVIDNPAFTPTNGAPRRIVAPNVGYALDTDGGVVLTPALGIQFGPDGAPVPFNPGFTAGGLSLGGDAQDLSQIVRLAVPVESKTAFTRLSFDVLPDLTAYAELSYADVEGTIYGRVFQRENITIRNDNAFLDPAMRAQMASLGLTSFVMGRSALDWGVVQGRNDREQQRYVAGVEGRFGSSWHWDAYYQHGETDFVNGDFINDPVTANFNRAVDAVAGPNGTIVCRSTLTNPGDGCVPLNLFGRGNSSAEARAYVNDAARSIQYLTIKQEVAAASVRGEPFSLWAGPVSIATGLEYRKEQYTTTTDPLSPSNAFFLGNFRPSSGHYEVKEAFFETVVPLLSDMRFARALDFNAAARSTDYSLSGSVTSWKAGLTYDLDDQVRLRGTASRDIRAPNLDELFQAGITQNQTIRDPATGSSYNIQQLVTGNTALVPEEADTTAIGIVYRPTWLSGFSASVDYFDISIDGAIFRQVSQTVIDGCFAGQAAQCAYVTRDPVSGRVTTVRLLPLNINAEATRGVDVEMSYRSDLSQLGLSFGGELTLRAIGTYVDTRTVTASGIETDYAGANANFDQSSLAVPDWRWLVSATYDRGPFSTTLTGRYIGDGVLNNAWGPADIDDNHVPAVTYADLAMSYTFERIGQGAQIYFAVDNLFDRDPPVAPIYGSTGFIQSGTNGYLYDVLGRRYRAGVRIKF